MKKRRQNGFTLAEVLITLVIIGVIAALTVPTLIQNTQKQEFVTGLKKGYSTLSQAVQAVIAEEGEADAAKGGWADTSENILNLLSRHLNTSAVCINTTDGICSKVKNTMYKHAFSSGKEALIDDSLVLNDGMIIGMHWQGYPGCDINYWGTNNRCADFFVDINGLKGPNKSGYDLFWFSLKNNGVYPTGSDDKTGAWCNTAKAGSTSYSNEVWGSGCAARVLRENAINY